MKLAPSFLLCMLLASCALEVDSAARRELAVQDHALSARRGSFTLSVRTRASAEGLVIEGRASSVLEHARAFVPDDEVGTTTVAGQRFVTLLPLNELTGRLLGSPLFLSLRTAQGRQEFARLDLELDLPAACATARMHFAPGSASVMVDGTPMVRFSGTTRLAEGEPSARVGASEAGPRWAGHRDGPRFWVDIPVDLAATAALTAAPLRFEVAGASGRTYRTCSVRAIPGELALTEGDPYDVWPAPRCDDALRSCLARPANQRDTSACGDAFAVSTCGRQPLPAQCGQVVAHRLANTVADTWWTSETDARLEPAVFEGAAQGPVLDALRGALGLPDDTPVEARELDAMLSWPAQDDPAAEPEERLRAARYRTLFRQLRAWLSDVQGIRVGTIRIDVYFLGRDACGNLAGLSTLAVET